MSLLGRNSRCSNRYFEFTVRTRTTKQFLINKTEKEYTISCISLLLTKDGQYGTFRICVLRTSHLEPYRTSVPYFNSVFEAYRTSVPYPYCHPCFWLLATITDFEITNLYISDFNLPHLASVSTLFCLCVQKTGAMCEKSGVFNSKSVPTYRTRNHYKKNVLYQRTVLS